MSAIVLPRLHVHCLVAAGFLRLPEEDEREVAARPMRFEIKPGNGAGKLGEDTADQIGQALVDANLSSVIAAGCAHPDCIAPEDIEPYAWPGLARALTTPVETLSAIDCFEYQSGDHPEWNGSTAHRYCTALRGRVAGLVPGYDAAGWLLLGERIAERTGWDGAGRPPDTIAAGVHRAVRRRGDTAAAHAYGR